MYEDAQQTLNSKNDYNENEKCLRFRKMGSYTPEIVA